ncbi:MAG: HepT-like ribonuclease domain-containing protein [Candidatus Aquilonibacter sp.]
MHSKPSREERIRNWCDDAIKAIERITSFIDGMDFETYQADIKTISAVERQLFIIAEVITRIPEFALTHESAYQVRGLANRLRHEYDAIDPRIIWDAVSGQPLADLRAAFIAFSPK